MSKPKKWHYWYLRDDWLPEYADTRTLDLTIKSDFHMRLEDPDYTVLDMWTTAKYYVLQTNYAAQAGGMSFVERVGEKGVLPIESKSKLFGWLDKLFYAVDMEAAS